MVNFHRGHLNSKSLGKVVGVDEKSDIKWYRWKGCTQEGDAAYSKFFSIDF